MGVSPRMWQDGSGTCRGGGMVYADGSNPSGRKALGVRLPFPVLDFSRLTTPYTRSRRQVGPAKSVAKRPGAITVTERPRGASSPCSDPVVGRGDDGLDVWLAVLRAGEAVFEEGAATGIVGVDLHHGIGGDCCGPNRCRSVHRSAVHTC